jgi:uncharacterized membrane protein
MTQKVISSFLYMIMCSILNAYFGKKVVTILVVVIVVVVVVEGGGGGDLTIQLI